MSRKHPVHKRSSIFFIVLAATFVFAGAGYVHLQQYPFGSVLGLSSIAQLLNPQSAPVPTPVSIRTDPATYLFFNPKTVTATSQNYTSLDLKMNTDGNLIQQIKLVISFDASKLSFVSFDYASPFSNLITNPEVSSGKITMTISGPTTGFSGSTHLFTMNFKPLNLAASPTDIIIEKETAVYSVSSPGTNMLKGTGGATVTFSTLYLSPTPNLTRTPPTSTPTYAPPTPTPTTTISCPKGAMTSFSVKVPCGNNMFRYGSVHCETGRYKSFGDAKSCTHVESLLNQAKEYCYAQAKCPTPTKLPTNSYQSPTPTTTYQSPTPTKAYQSPTPTPKTHNSGATM